MNVMLHPVPVPDLAARFIAKPLQLLIGDAWVNAKSGKTFDVFDPSTGLPIAKAAEGDAADIDAAVAAARRAFEERSVGTHVAVGTQQAASIAWATHWKRTPRNSPLSRRSTTASRSATRARSMFPARIEMFRYMAGWATRLNGETIPVSAPGNWHAYTLREPVGVVGQIIPWNFPLMMAAWKLAPALAAGCTIVLKPAEQTPLSAAPAWPS